MPADRSSSIVPIFLFAILCAACTWLVLHLLARPLTWPYLVILLYFTIVTLMLHRWQERAVGADVRRFIRRFMAGLVIKLLVSLVVMAILAFVVREEKTPIIVAFVLLYLGWLGFSTGRLVMLLKQRAA